MTRRIKHHHPCQACGTKTECFGELVENYDGDPACICVEFHLPAGAINDDFICEGCVCLDCYSERHTTTTRIYTGPDTYREETVCASCKRKRENAEPIDGEAWAGGFAANH